MNQYNLMKKLPKMTHYEEFIMKMTRNVETLKNNRNLAEGLPVGERRLDPILTPDRLVADQRAKYAAQNHLREWAKLPYWSHATWNEA